MKGRPLPILAVAGDSPQGRSHRQEGQGRTLGDYALEVAAAHKDGADGGDEVVHGIDIGGGVSPCGHGAGGSEESAEKHQTDDEEPHDKDGLLHGIGIVGNDESEGTEKQGKQQGKEIDEEQAALAGDAVKEPGEEQAEGDKQQGDNPIRNELGKDEGVPRNGGDVNLLDGAGFFLAYDVERGQKSAHHHQEDGEKGGYHVSLVAELLVVEIQNGQGFVAAA